MSLEGFWQFATGGIISFSIARITFRIPAAPAVSSVWPMFAFTLPIGIFLLLGASPGRTSAKASASVASPRAVEVA